MAIAEAEDFRAESEAVYGLLAPLAEGQFDQPTAFKGWTFNHVLTHLHFWNQMAGFQLTNEALLVSRLGDLMASGGGMREAEARYSGGLGGHSLLAAWRETVDTTADAFAAADPKQRLKWVGPDMGARSSITARLMETWAHGQEMYDELGVQRVDADRIRSIVVLGVNTYGWTFKNRRQDPPSPMPHIVLTAPSGAIWTFGDENETERIEGSATEFCQVVTQTRNVADTRLAVSGPNATAWMAVAQCFAGPPETPPAPGTRKINQKAH